MGYSVKIIDNTDKVDAKFDAAIKKAMNVCGAEGVKFAKKACPVDTGNLRNSITYAMALDGKTLYIGTNVEYASSVELGTSRQTAQPYLKPAIANHTKRYSTIIKNALKKG